MREDWSASARNTIAAAVLSVLLLVLQMLPGLPGLPAPARAGAQGARPVATWLDALWPWNAAGAAVPAAPPTPLPGPPITERCVANERAPESPEEVQVAAAGWRLEGYWPAQRAGTIAVILATASYDGMCRPWDFNGFVFDGGRFAGTLAPAPMRSRFDGQLSLEPTLTADGQITARFLRYAPTDAFCCPTLPASIVTYRIDRVGGTPVLTALRVMAQAPAPQLPRTGEGTTGLALQKMLSVAGILVLAGLTGRAARRAQQLTHRSYAVPGWARRMLAGVTA
jgi:hypothetical protein